MITDDEGRAAHDRIHEMTTLLGVAKGELHRLEQRRKAAFAIAKKQADGTIADKEAAAYLNPLYAEALNAEIEAIAAYESLRAENKAQEITAEMWRTTQANFRVGAR